MHFLVLMLLCTIGCHLGGVGEVVDCIERVERLRRCDVDALSQGVGVESYRIYKTTYGGLEI